MSSSEENESISKREKYNEYMRNYRLLNAERISRIGKRKYYKKKYADTLQPEDVEKYKKHIDKVCVIRRALFEILNENPETAYALIMDIVSQIE